MALVKETQEPPALSTKEICKSFAHIDALINVSIDFPQNRISAVVGDNGAGKSTLIKVLSGALIPDRGKILVGERDFAFLTPARAIKCGIATVFQDLSLINCRDVVSNIFLGHEPTKGRFFIDRRLMEKKAAELLDRLNIKIPSLRHHVGELSGGQRQAVAIARAINQGGKVLILDEPTAAMGVKEAGKTLALISELREKGYTVILISHNIHQVFALSDWICVMRKGCLAARLETVKTTPNEIIRLITGWEEDQCAVI